MFVYINVEDNVYGRIDLNIRPEPGPLRTSRRLGSLMPKEAHETCMTLA